MSSYFPNKLRVEKSYLKQIVTTRSWVNDEDAVKLYILYLLEFFICPSDKDHVSFVDHFRFYLVEYGQYESYPWGIKSFTQMMESVRHRLNPYVHSYRGCSLELQVWLYKCCSTVSTDLATRCSNSIPRILRWSASKGQIWIAAFEEKMIKPEWIKVPNVDPLTLEPKQTDGEEDKESIAKKIRKLEKGIEQVDGKLEDFRKAVFVELDSLRGFINKSVQTALQMINNRNVQDDAKSPIHGVTVVAQTEQVIEEHDNEGADAQYVDLGDSEGSGVEKNGVTLDDFELPDNLSQMVKFSEPIQYDSTPMHPGRTRHPEKHARSPFISPYSFGGSSSVGPKIFYLKHPFTIVISEEVDLEVLDNFNKRKTPFSIKNNQIKPWLDLGVEKVDKKEWFFSLAHPGQVLNDSDIDVLMYYLRKRGKYGPYNKTRFTTTNCLFKTRIEQIYEKFINSPPQKKYSVVKPQDVVAEYILGYRLLVNVAWDDVDYVIMPVNIVKKFHWVLVVFDIADMQLYAYDSMVSSCNNQVVESCVEKFSVIIPLYLSCSGFYGKRKDINFKNTKAYIEKPVTDPINIQWSFGEIPQQKEGSLDCGVFVAAFAEYVSLGDLSIPAEDLSDIDQHRRRYGALLRDYATKKQEDGSISESEVTGILARRKGAPALNEKTRVQRKKK
ncbi:uncharacterized protein [Nicotiana sylvestris]|uniref:uncharacterized protein n=1 Tax=Nicotiana sylvestris TaxID=4096 RepID=UPI00388CC0E4